MKSTTESVARHLNRIASKGTQDGPKMKTITELGVVEMDRMLSIMAGVMDAMQKTLPEGSDFDTKAVAIEAMSLAPRLMTPALKPISGPVLKAPLAAWILTINAALANIRTDQPRLKNLVSIVCFEDGSVTLKMNHPDTGRGVEKHYPKEK